MEMRYQGYARPAAGIQQFNGRGSILGQDHIHAAPPKEGRQRCGAFCDGRREREPVAAEGQAFCAAFRSIEPEGKFEPWPQVLAPTYRWVPGS